MCTSIQNYNFQNFSVSREKTINCRDKLIEQLLVFVSSRDYMQICSTGYFRNMDRFPSVIGKHRHFSDSDRLPGPHALGSGCRKLSNMEALEDTLASLNQRISVMSLSSRPALDSWESGKSSSTIGMCNIANKTIVCNTSSSLAIARQLPSA